MAEKVSFELVSPERLLASIEADMVVVPGAEGNFGVLPRHSPFMSLVRPGVIDIHEKGEITQQIFIEGGFAEVNPEGLIVLAEAATPLDEITREQAAEVLRNAEDEHRASGDEVERARLVKIISIARIRLEAVS
ncbi:MAG: ATP synthase F1 subunit epsilon [Geminicoccaceae bacterium]|nr:ATP synthase F1 subunit epsilon [Geminicoccaceae bacterium]MCB9944239.1 ATP synthase F1 subunit epsilon [Geminicoccaceae bacterium]